jgi:RNA polymerase sigma-32 factor
MTIEKRDIFDLRRCVPMEREEENRCATEYRKTGARVLADRLVTANLRLVVTIARGYQRSHCDLRDMVQEGNLGLMRAVEKFDPARGVKLCSYAAWWIRAYIMKYTLDAWRLVKAGTTQVQRKLFFQLRKAQRKLEAQGIRPSASELASLIGVEEAEVVEMLQRFAGGEVSLDAPRSRDPNGNTIGDSLPAPSASQPDTQIEHAEFVSALGDKLAAFKRTLKGRELDIFRQRLLSEEPVTLVQLASSFGVTRERTRQLEFRLKGRIRDYLRDELGDAVEPMRAAA